jgi:hypothetical protein
MPTITPTHVAVTEVVIEGGHLVGYVTVTFAVPITTTGTPPYPLAAGFGRVVRPIGSRPHLVDPPDTLVDFVVLRYFPWYTNPDALSLHVPTGDTSIHGPAGQLVTGGDYPVTPL